MNKMKASLFTYWSYFKYILLHKWYVGCECMKLGLYVHAFTHDLSKFLPSEFFSYAEKFFSTDYVYKSFEVEYAFNIAWCHHQHRNKHHWDYWVCSDGMAIEMPPKYILQMIVDWKGMGKKFNDTAYEFYVKEKGKMILAVQTKWLIETILNKEKITKQGYK